MAPRRTASLHSPGEIELVVNSGTGDWVALIGKSGAATVGSGNRQRSIRLNMNAQETTGVDADLTVNGSGSLFVSSATGNDRFLGQRREGHRAALARDAGLLGGTGNDVVTGGAGGDSLHT